ncbi:MAG: ATP-binding protein, partial [Thiohalocapsa sp.]
LDQRKEGSGLGLAIARDVVDAYGGELQFRGADAGGLEVRVRLPTATSPSIAPPARDACIASEPML